MCHLISVLHFLQQFDTDSCSCLGAQRIGDTKQIRQYLQLVKCLLEERLMLQKDNAFWHFVYLMFVRQSIKNGSLEF